MANGIRQGRLWKVKTLLFLAILLTGCTSDTDSISTSSQDFGIKQSSSTTTPTGSSDRYKPPAGSQVVPVASVIDGDTIRIVVEGIQEDVRLIGINAPERGECLANEATNRLTELLSGGRVVLESDVSDRDQYGRLLRYLYLDQAMVNEMMVAEGFAIARRYEPDTKYAEVLESAQAAAQTQERGLWAMDACGHASGATIKIGGVQYDAPGDDASNKNGEWVDLRNTGQAAVDMSGWVLKDESATHRYVFPEGFVLQPEASVRVLTGCGIDSSTELYWCVSQSAVWNNSGDTAFIMDPPGNVVDAWSY